MPNKDELDSPTTVVGEDEYFPTSREKELIEANEKLRSELEVKEKKLEQKNDRIISQEKKISELKKKLKDYSEANEEFFEANEELWEKLQGKSAFCDALDQAYGNLTTENENLREELEEVLEIKRNLENSLKKLSQELQEESELVDLKDKRIDDLMEAVQERDKLRTKVRTLRRKLNEKERDWQEEVDELDAETKELKNNLGALAVELGKERIKNKKLAADKEKFRELAEDYKWLYDRNREKKVRLFNKLQAIRKQQETDAENAKKKNVCQTLVKWEGIPKNEGILNNNELEKSIMQTNSSFINTVANTQEHLGVDNLTQITTTHQMPENKSLGDLIEFYEDNKDGTPTPPSQSPHIITKLEAGEPNETVLINQIITECDLGLNENSSLTQVIERINKLIEKKPPVVRPVKQPTDTPFGESLAKIVEIDLNGLEKELGIELSSEVKEQIQKVNNYQELSLLRNREIKSYLERGQNTGITSQPGKEIIKPNQTERLIWAGLLVVSLMAIVGLLVRMKSVMIKGRKKVR